MKTRMRNMMMIAALAAMTIGGVSSAQAQDNILDKKIESAEYQQADIREALKTLFRQVDANYSILPEVQGTVTINMKNARFELVLQNLLNQVNATFRYEAGVFVIVPRPPESNPLNPGDETTPGPGPTPPKITRKIYIRSMDPMLMAMLIGQSGQNWSGSPEPMSLGRMGGGGMGGGGGMMGGGGMGGMGGGMMGGGGMGGMGGGGMMGGGGGMMGGGGGMMGGGGGMMGGGGGGFGGGF